MVTINGEQKDIAGHNLYQYLKEEGFNLKAVVVERNLEILQKDSRSMVHSHLHRFGNPFLCNRKLLRNIPIAQNAPRGCDQMYEEYVC